MSNGEFLFYVGVILLMLGTMGMIIGNIYFSRKKKKIEKRLHEKFEV